VGRAEAGLAERRLGPLAQVRQRGAMAGARGRKVAAPISGGVGSSCQLVGAAERGPGRFGVLGGRPSIHPWRLIMPEASVGQSEAIDEAQDESQILTKSVSLHRRQHQTLAVDLMREGTQWRGKLLS
jgi:hypothetical protein